MEVERIEQLDRLERARELSRIKGLTDAEIIQSIRDLLDELSARISQHNRENQHCKQA